MKQTGHDRLVRRATGWRILLCSVLVAACGLGSLIIAQMLFSPRTALVSSRGQILWSADHETGDLSQWYTDQDGSVFNTGTGKVTITSAAAHSGRHAIALTIEHADGQVQAARIFRWNENPEEAYYSAWLFFPQRYEPELWWNVFQFKSKIDGTSEGSTSMWSLDVGNRSDGDMYFYLWDAINERAYHAHLTPQSIPVGRWIHIEAFYSRATERTGRIIVWQDSVKLFDRDHVQTAIGSQVDWSLANYTDGITPSTATIYADDAAISTTRIGERGYGWQIEIAHR